MTLTLLHAHSPLQSLRHGPVSDTSTHLVYNDPLDLAVLGALLGHLPLQLGIHLIRIDHIAKNNHTVALRRIPWRGGRVHVSI